MSYSIEPVSLADVKAYLSLPLADSSEDALLNTLVESCRDQCEIYLGRAVAQSDKTYVTESARIITLPDEPESVLSVMQIHTDGTQESLTDFSVLADGTVLCPSADPGARLVIAYTTLFWCPPSVRTAILMAVKNLYMDRQTSPMTADVVGLLRPYYKRSRV